MLTDLLSKSCSKISHGHARSEMKVEERVVVAVPRSSNETTKTPALDEQGDVNLVARAFTINYG